MTFFSMSLTEKNAKMKNTLEHFFFFSLKTQLYLPRESGNKYKIVFYLELKKR